MSRDRAGARSAETWGRPRLRARLAGGGASTAVALAALLVASATLAQPAAPERSDFVHFRELLVPARSGTGHERVMVTWPRRADGADHPPGERLPILVALHGRGETRGGIDAGILGWIVDYELPAAFGALGRGRLRRSDLGGYVRDEHLAARNAALASRAFGGVLVVTPYTPDLADAPSGGPEIAAYSRWLAGPVLEAVRERFDFAARTREGTAIDGVSLGGMLALEAGFGHPESFAAVGAIQPAVSERFAALAALAEPARQQIRLLTSDEDPFLAPTRALSDLLTARSVEHDLLVVPGPHGYAFNRGPGSVELLWFADRVLAREPL